MTMKIYPNLSDFIILCNDYTPTRLVNIDEFQKYYYNSNILSVYAIRHYYFR